MVTRLTAELALDSRCELGEGPVWDAQTDELVWVDIPGRRVLRYRPREGRTGSIPTPGDIGSVAIRRAGGLVAALADGFWMTDGDGSDWRQVAAVGADRPDLRFNDGKCDPVGRFLAGTMAYDKRRGAAALYQLAPDGRVEQLLSGVTISNGLAWSEDGRTMFYIDTPTHRVDAFDYDVDSGRMSGRRSWISVPEDGPGAPDGMTIDADGGLWIALWGGWAVHRYDRDGRLDAVVDVPASHVTSCTFGGPTFEDLYITSAWSELDDAERAAQPHAGSVFIVRPGRQGLQPIEFADGGPS